MPGWMQGIATYNPVEWAVRAGREGIAADPDWVIVLSRMGWLLLFAVVCGWLATAAFRVYQKSI
jgi:ABC-2 type transport system permease protein